MVSATGQERSFCQGLGLPVEYSVKLGWQLLLYNLGHMKTSLRFGQKAKGSASKQTFKELSVSRHSRGGSVLRPE